ncbi:hypothetical protein FRB98_007278, partial [Tulasnella sp. 332]
MEVNAAISAYIFLVLRIPACEKFSIAVTILKYTFISEAQQHHTSVLTSQVAFAAVISISFSEQGLCYEASEGGSIYLKAPESLTDSLAWIINCIHRPEPSVHTRLSISTPDFLLSALTMCRLASSFTTLDVYKNRDIIYYLSQPMTLEAFPCFPLPNLRELALESFTELKPQGVIPVAESRFGRIG